MQSAVMEKLNDRNAIVRRLHSLAKTNRQHAQVQMRGEMMDALNHQLSIPSMDPRYLHTISLDNSEIGTSELSVHPSFISTISNNDSSLNAAEDRLNATNHHSDPSDSTHQSTVPPNVLPAEVFQASQQSTNFEPSFNRRAKKHHPKQWPHLSIDAVSETKKIISPPNTSLIKHMEHFSHSHGPSHPPKKKERLHLRVAKDVDIPDDYDDNRSDKEETELSTETPGNPKFVLRGIKFWKTGELIK